MGEDTAAPKRSKVDKGEILIAFLLGIAAIATAWASYQSALLQGDSLKEMNRSVRTADSGSQQWNEGNQDYTSQVQLFIEFAKASYAEDTELAAYFKDSLMEEDFAKAVQWWVDDKEGYDSPFYEENTAWKVPGWTEGERLDALAEKQFKKGARLDNRGDRYDLVTVILATSLFLFGMASILHGRAVRLGMTTVGILFLGASIVRMLDIGYYPG